MAALSCVLLYLTDLLPVMRLSLLFVASLLPVALADERRWADALLAFAASALVSGLLFPAPGAWLLYVAFFGWYGVLREFAAGKLNKVLRWVVLAAAFNAALLPLYFLARGLLPQVKLPEFLVVPAAEAAFVLFEVLFGLCREYYVRRVRDRLFK